jgi:hypothetical protein
MCESCKAAMVAMLNQRIRAILAQEQQLKEDDGDGDDTAQSHCFHLMEVRRILEGLPTCGVYDDYGRTNGSSAEAIRGGGPR